MPEKRNYLLGYGERLTAPVENLFAFLREIERAATPGPWRVVGVDGHIIGNVYAEAVASGVKHHQWSHNTTQGNAAAIATARNLFAALLDVAEAAARIQREAAAAGWGDAAGWDMAELNAPMQSNDKALDRLREAMEANRG